jgi:hypothetical protein
MQFKRRDSSKTYKITQNVLITLIGSLFLYSIITLKYQQVQIRLFKAEQNRIEAAEDVRQKPLIFIAGHPR